MARGNAAGGIFSRIGGAIKGGIQRAKGAFGGKKGSKGGKKGAKS